MYDRISTTRLAEAIDVPLSRITTWVNRGYLASERPRKWSWAEAVAVGMFAQAMRGMKSAADAGARAAGMSRVVGELLDEAAAGAPPGAWDRLIFISASFPDGTVQDHSARTVEEAGVCAGTMLLRGAVHVEVIDASDTFRAVCAAFAAAEAEARAAAEAKVPA